MDVPIDVSNTVLTTQRLVLRPLTLSDLDDFYAYASVPGVGEAAGWKHHQSVEESETILRSLMETGHIFAIEHWEDGRLIGTLGLHTSWTNETDAYRRYQVKEIGYVLSKAYWGHGLMTEAVQAVIGYCFDTLHLDALTCCHFTENCRSRRVIEKCGFRFARMGTFRSETLEKTFDDMQYILFADAARN